MRKEEDIVNELGYRNWLDVVAGEAVILGHMSNDPTLVAKGTKLATLIRKGNFYDDDFSKVVAYGVGLVREISNRKHRERATQFLDCLYKGEKDDKSCYDWEYDLVSADGRYAIWMFLPEYYGTGKLLDPVKMEIEKRVQTTYSDPSFISYTRSEEINSTESQVFENVRYFDEAGVEVRRSVEFNHEGRVARGRNDYYYFDDLAQALTAWQEVKEVFTSSQKK